MSREDRVEWRPLVRKLVEELREAYHRTSVESSSWIHLRNAYLLALSLERLLEEEAQKQNTAHPT